MGFVIPVGIKPPFEKLPTGFILFNIDGIADGDLAKAGDPEIYGFLVDLTAEEPSECAGITKEERFYLGVRETDKRVQDKKMEADPRAEKEATLIATLGRFKAFAAAAGVEIEGKDTDVIFSELKNRKVIGKVELKMLKARPGQPQSDEPFAQVNRWLPVGTVDPHVTEEARPTAPGAGPQPAPARAAAPAAPAAPKAAAPAGRPTPTRLGARTATA